MIPFPKSGDIEDPINFRPNNLVSVLSKILGKSIQLTEHLRKILNESQYAYRNSSCTEQTLVNISEQIYKSMEESESNYLSFSIVPKPLAV